MIVYCVVTTPEHGDRFGPPLEIFLTKEKAIEYIEEETQDWKGKSVYEERKENMIYCVNDGDLFGAYEYAILEYDIKDTDVYMKKLYQKITEEWVAHEKKSQECIGD